MQIIRRHLGRGGQGKRTALREKSTRPMTASTKLAGGPKARCTIKSCPTLKRNGQAYALLLTIY